jgi:ABC-2 type transport system permease protein
MSVTHEILFIAYAKVYRFFQTAIAIAGIELIKVWREPVELLARVVQPLLWLVIFGQVFSNVHAIPLGTTNYLTFIAPGILAQSIIFSAIFYGIAIIWEKDLGIVQKLLVSPSYRSALVFGKSMASGIRSLIQSILIFVLAVTLDIKLKYDPYSLFMVIFLVFIGSGLFSTFSLIIACLVKTREKFMGIGQLLTMPLFFASNAIYPISMMPDWLKQIAYLNPLTYLVDALRAVMIFGEHSLHGVQFNTLVILSIYLILHIIAAKLYPFILR